MGKAAFLLLAVLFQSSGVSGDWTSDSRYTWRDDDGEPSPDHNRHRVSAASHANLLNSSSWNGRIEKRMRAQRARIRA